MAPMRTGLSLIAASCLLAAGACGGSSPGDDSPSRVFLSIGTAPPGGAFFVVGGALAEVVNEHGADQGFSVTAEATSGSRENIRRLTSGEVDFALSNAAITYFAVRGTEGWDRAYPVQTVMTLAQNVGQFIAPADSGIESLDDLRGERVAVGPAGAGFEYWVRPILSAHGITYDDFTPLNATQQAAVDMLTDGSAGAALLGGAVPTAAVTQAAASMDVTFLALGNDEKRQLIDEYLFYSAATIPADTYRGQTEPFEGLDVGSMHFITSADTSEDLVYAVTKLLYDNRTGVVEKHAAGRWINPDNVVRDTGTEFHAGAIRFYREIGIWPE